MRLDGMLMVGLGLAALVGCSQASTTGVDPDTAGRLQGPFAAGEPQQIFDLPDELADQKVLCDVVALSNGVVTARGDRTAVAEGGTLTAVNVFLSPNVTNDGPADQTPPPVPGQVVGEAPIP